MEKLVIRVPVADLRAEPEHRSERTSQALFGYTVQVLERREQFLRVETEDRYQSWLAASYCAESSAASGHEVVVSSNFATVESHQSTLILGHGSRLLSGAGGRFLSPIDGSPLMLRAGQVLDRDVQPAGNPIELARQFIGIPYLWGGISTFGFDCSGLTQAIFRRQGIILPRDSKDQAKEGEEVAREQVQPGDLLFWPGHVALYAGEQSIIHATRLRGMVVEESLDRKSKRFRDDLSDSITSIRRIAESN